MMESKYKKYPKTLHLPWSPGLQNDDRVIETLTALETCDEVVVTEKMDGECTTMYDDNCHARSLNSGSHLSRWQAKQVWGSLRWSIGPNMRVCGENLYAKHSIHYEKLTSFFQIFNIWTDDRCWDWDRTKRWAQEHWLYTVPEIWRGKYNKDTLVDIGRSLDVGSQEGFVVRVTSEFTLDQFSTHIAKFVRESHVQTDEHWMYQKVIPNKLMVK